MDPRQMVDLDIYELHPPIERVEFKGEPRQAPNRAFDVQHTRLELTLDEGQGEVAGRATITLRPFVGGLREIELDAAQMNFSRVVVKNGRATPETSRFKTHGDRIRIALDRECRESELLTVVLDYKCRPKAGLYFIRPDQFYPDRPNQVWSQGADQDNHHWFPCFDHPNDKMTSELILTVRENQTALSNGRLVSVKHNKKNRTKTFHWSQEQPHSSYLVSLAVGDYAEIKDSYKGRPVRYYVYRDRVKDAPALFGKTPKMIRYFSKLFGFEYPYPKYDQVLVSEFPFGAMENTTATTISDRALLDRHAARDVSNQDLVAHELAHQWWGNVVTCKDWSHAWLNEGFATYAEALFTEHERGWDEARFSLIREYISYIHEDRGRYRRPIVSNKYIYPIELFDRHTYQKGALVVDMLRFVLGDEAFFKTIRHFLKKFQWQNVETDDLRRAIEEVTGQNLDWFFQQWLHKAGYPEFVVTQSYDRRQKLLRLTVQQAQQTDALTPVFRTPVDIEIITREGARVHRVTIERGEQDFFFSVESEPLAVNFDRGNRILKSLSFDRPKEDLLHLLRKSDDATARLRAARELAAFPGDDVIAALGEAVASDKFWGVRVAAAAALGEIGGESALSVLIESYGRARDNRVRRACVWAAGAFKKNESAHSFLERALDNDESLFVQATAIRALGNVGRDGVFDTITRALVRETYQDVIRLAVFDALVFMKERRGIDVAMEWSEAGRSQSARVGAIVALGSLAKEHREERERVMKRLTEALKDQTHSVRAAAIRALGHTDDPSAIALLREAERTEVISQLKLAAHRAVERLEELKQKSSPAVPH